MDPLEVLDSESSPEANSQDVDSGSSTADVAGTMEDAIRDAVQLDIVEDAEEAPEAEPESSPVEEVVETTQEETQEEEPQPELDDDAAFIKMLQDNDVPLGKIERFKELIEERKHNLEQIDELGKVRDNIQNIELEARKAGLTQDQINNWYQMPYLLNNDPAKAQQLINDFMADLGAATGERLPDDLQQKVDDGYMDLESAKRLARAEAQQAQMERRTEFDAEQQKALEAQNHQTQIVNAVNTYQKSLQETDPDYDRKHGFVKDRITALMAARGGQLPASPDEAIALVKQAHKEVTDQMAALQPKREPRRVISGRGSNTPAASAPASMFEAIAGAVGGVSED